MLGFTIGLLIFTGIQVIQSTLRTMEEITSLVQLTYVDADENNQDNIRHPFYTICPILDEMADLDEPNATLLSVMVANSIFHPVVTFFNVFNTAKLVTLMFSNVLQSSVTKCRLTGEHYTTWVKMKPSHKEQKASLVKCTTLNIPQNITLGHIDGFVSGIQASDPKSTLSLFVGKCANIWENSRRTKY